MFTKESITNWATQDACDKDACINGIYANIATVLSRLKSISTGGTLQNDGVTRHMAMKWHQGKYFKNCSMTYGAGGKSPLHK